MNTYATFTSVSPPTQNNSYNYFNGAIIFFFLIQACIASQFGFTTQAGVEENR